MCNCLITSDEEIVEKITADNDDMRSLERFYFEYRSMFDLAVQFTSDSPYKPDMERYPKIIEQYVESYAAFNILWNALIQTYASKYQFEDNYLIHADFENNQLIVKRNGGCSNGKCQDCNNN